MSLQLNSKQPSLSLSPVISTLSAAPGVKKLENSHLIQVTSNRRSLWRGNEQMKLHCSVKVDRRFLKSDLYSYKLVAYVEDCITKEVKYNRMVKGFSLDLHVKDWSNNGSNERNNEDNSWIISGTEGYDDSSTVNITQDDLYYELDASIPKSMYGCGDQIRVIVEAAPLFPDCSVSIYGASQVIV